MKNPPPRYHITRPRLPDEISQIRRIRIFFFIPHVYFIMIFYNKSLCFRLKNLIPSMSIITTESSYHHYINREIIKIFFHNFYMHTKKYYKSNFHHHQIPIFKIYQIKISVIFYSISNSGEHSISDCGTRPCFVFGKELKNHFVTSTS